MRVWAKAGHVGIDSGTLMVGDPCYHLHKDARGEDAEARERFHKAFGKSWRDLCTKLSGLEVRGSQELGNQTAVVVPTGQGDGCYRVYIRRGKSGHPEIPPRIEAVKVVFIRRSKDTLPVEKKAKKRAAKKNGG